MSVSSLFSNAASSTDPLSALSAPSTTTASAAVSSGTTGTTPAIGAAAATSISSGASLLAQLQQLSFSNPAAFKKATADIATQLQTDAAQTGGSQGQALTSLAGKFQQASQTGELSPLKPAHHGGHHHGGGSSASAAAAYQQNGASGTAGGTSLSTQITDALSTALTQGSGTAAAPAA